MIKNNIIGNNFLSLIYLCAFFILIVSITDVARASDTPDLIIQDITWTPTNPSLGDAVTFTAVIMNQGNGSSNNGYIHFYLDGSTSPLTYKSFTTIDAGSTTTVSFAWNAQAGSCAFKAVVDKDNKITESDETNNEKTTAFSATSLSDLVIQDITWTPTNPSIGDAVTFTATIKNQGNGSSSSSSVYFYLDGSTSYLKYKNFGGIFASATTTVSFTWNAQSGSHTFKAVVDKDNTVAESDETNNEKTTSFSATSLSDLVVQNINWTPTSSSIGDAITFTATIKNQGNGSSNNGYVHFYFDDSNTHYTYQSFDGITAGSTTTVSFTWKAQKGSHTLKALVDKDNIITEIDEKNNENTVTFSVVSLSDLVVQDITWTPRKPSIGDTVTFLLTIKNQGTGESSNGNVYLYLDNLNNAFDTVHFIKIPSGGTTKVSANWIAQVGLHTIRMSLSEGAIKTESDQTNNEKTITISAYDTNPPQIALNSQIKEYNKNNILEEGEKLDLSYGAYDDSSGINSIKLFINNKLIDLKNRGGTYTKMTDSLPMGEYVIKVVAVDKASNEAEETISVTVQRTGPSVYFGSTKTEIKEGENAIIILSAVNPIGNLPMNVQLILKPPSGVSIYKTDWIEGGVGSYEGEFVLEPGDVRGISIGMHINQPGTHYVNSEIYYEVEGKRIVQHDRLEFVVRPIPTPTPGFEAVFAMAGLLLLALLTKRRQGRLR